MRKVAPSVLVREELDRLLRQGAGPGGNIISELVSMVTQLVVQEVLEAEQTDFLGGRGRYERREGSGGMRNGYEPGRVRTAEGVVDVRVPQVREAAEPLRSTLMGFFWRATRMCSRTSWRRCTPAACPPVMWRTPSATPPGSC